MTGIKVNKIPAWNESVNLEDVANAAGANDEVLLPFDEADQKLVVLVDNSAAASATLTVKPGDMPMSGAEDYVITVPGNTAVAIALESGRFKKKDGYVHVIASAATLGFQLIAMP